MIEPLDLARHAVFEASAGTGKTYTIMRLVLRLLREQRCRLDEILIVTFTEKATGELKDRLRRDLESAIDRDSAAAAILQSQLDRFDRASISTIHSFCKRLLQDHAADLGQDFQSEMVQEAPLRLEALREVQRKDWHEKFGARLPDVLRAAGYCRGSETKWESSLRKILDKYRPECGHRLLPETLPVLGDDQAMKSALAAYTVARVRERVREAKRQRGVMTFDDLIERVEAGLDPARNPRANVVAGALREQFRFAIVDEFQDTDPMQWAIFRRLFLEGGTTRLIVVGDPKQAIYGFRGADLPTYLRATHEMVETWGAASFPLGVNWRSSPNLIEGLNRFFGAGTFFPADKAMTYTPVAAPPPEMRLARLADDKSGRTALTIVDVTGDSDTAARQARLAYANFTAREIRRLLEGERGEPALRIQDKAGVRPLSARDICILVFRGVEAKVFKAALARQRIPFSHYKSGGVRVTPEARDIRLVLKALAHPEQNRFFTRVLLTMFFRVLPADLMGCDSLPSEHAARRLFDSWRHLADERKWSVLFNSMLEDTGVLFRDRAGTDYDRRVANLKLLLGQLQEAGYRSNLDLFELLDQFDDAETEEDENDDYQPQETDEPRVQIMTIFASKGLEFPVVFVGGGFTNETQKDIAYRDADNRLVFDLAFAQEKPDKDDPRSLRIDDDRVDELRRLLYVALTRAQFKLYCPIMETKVKADKAALVALVKPAFEKCGLANASEIATVIVPGENAGSRPKRILAAAAPKPKLLVVDPLLPEIDAGIAQRRFYVRSFTGMHREAKREQADAFGDRPDRLDEVHEPSLEAADPFRGPVFGEMVHEIFEQVDFAEIKAAKSEAELDAGAVGQLIADQTARFVPRLTTRAPDAVVAEQCRRLLRGMVWNALRTRLVPLGGMLCEVPRRDCLIEMEFLYPNDVQSGECSTYVKGFMDLVFRWKGLVYLLDWKTNVLPTYDAAGMEAAMADAGYDLQYSLYGKALSRWLGRVPGKLRLGGVFYLFLRGLSGADDGRGVYFVTEKALAARIKRDG